jgi:N-carbamoylputrescine amidase
MRVAVGQMEPKICDMEENLTRVQRILEEADREGVEVLVLPELCNSGYVFQTIDEARDSAEQIPDGLM